AAEVMIGITAEDLARTQAEGDAERAYRFRNKWFGRSTWRSRTYGNPVRDFIDEQNRLRIGWPPVKAGLFGGKSTERANLRTRQYGEKFEQVAEQYSW